ncbi:MAG: ribonuclease T [Gammaproteobacteria bacterium]|jgi:ribonuclease T|nr:ribonuclease T [Gammaproteobacteria bacterium]MBT4605911.1 ribonuclease T [Thiotrichales bacterium]MBT3473780.1 ribonuclease T [Gammaproteobacteria bacterium]MBT3967519.1 ribonuclease T [Gammaproteobacteria bacterium]MBT4081260.1 ribonuclease T [Gammaproteobacteria bacterium]
MAKKAPIAKRFRGFLPVVVDVETGGFDAKKDALLEIAASILNYDENGQLAIQESHEQHVLPFKNANLDPKALEFIGLKDPWHPFRMAIEEPEALKKIFEPIRKAVRATGCSRAILIGHNAWFDLGFVNAAIERCKIKNSPFHAFSSFDTATLGGVFYGQTVLARMAEAADVKWNHEAAHSALYDTEETAKLFCKMVNDWDQMSGRFEGILP